VNIVRGLLATSLAGVLPALAMAGVLREDFVEQSLAQVMARRPVVLLGEVHDNAAQHATRAAALRRLLAGGARPAIAFEQFDRERQADIDRASGRFIDYRRGEIVSLQIPGEPRGRVLKRVRGGPGDPVLAGGTLLRSLGPDEFVVDDDLARNGFTVLERTEIEGRVLLRAWPLSRLKWRPGMEP
jgi:hypothetical protein